MLPFQRKVPAAAGLSTKARSTSARFIDALNTIWMDVAALTPEAVSAGGASGSDSLRRIAAGSVVSPT